MTRQKTLRTCKAGHRYYKSSDCNTCPVCEASAKQNNSWCAGLSAPARRALEGAGIDSVKKLSMFTKAEILALHGLGPSSVPKLHAILAANGQSFRDSKR